MGEYIMDMRKRVGPIPLMQCGASVIVENEKGEILLQLRSDNGQWAYAGGSIELFERVQDAAARELEEETGLVAEELELLGVYSGPEMRYVYPNGDETSNVDIVYVCRKYHGALRCEAGEVEKLGFFPWDRLPGEIFSVCQPALEDYRKARQEQAQG